MGVGFGSVRNVVLSTAKDDTSPGSASVGVAYTRLGNGGDMRHYWLFGGALLALFGLLFVLFEALGLPLLEDPSPWLASGGVGAALLGVGLLVVDVLLPIPSNLVMITHGALFGIVTGTLLSLLGSMGAFLAGFWIGRRGGPLLARFVPLEERTRADRLLRRWGLLAILASRPIPLLAETVAVLAGASPVGWRRASLAALLGLTPPGLLYAWVGATAASFEAGVLVFGLVMLLAAGVGLLGRQAEARASRR